jgi:hypothetical protein
MGPTSRAFRRPRTRFGLIDAHSLRSSGSARCSRTLGRSPIPVSTMTGWHSEYEFIEAPGSQEFGGPPEERYTQALASRLVEEMAASWRNGERPPAEIFLARHSELVGDPDAAMRLIYEEICLCQEAGEEVSADEITRRFPQWQAELRALLECHDVLQSSTATPPLPAVGETLADFRLLKELGRGAQGRVFLAAQTGLADRLVVVKVTLQAGQEHLSLARLQHTHIVPLYAVQDLPERKLRLLCMPYMAGTTLARLLEAMRGVPLERRTGQRLLDVIDRAHVPMQADLRRRGPGRQALARASYPEAVCWIGACLAEALHYAHERGLLHLDVKPSNVLLASDGQPMLLDFHLARGPLAKGGPPPDWLGGTLAYMAPEHRAAVTSVRDQQPIVQAVTSRCDVYALGLVLYEALSARLPGEVERPRLERINPQVSVGLADIVHKCLAPAPTDRRFETTSEPSPFARPPKPELRRTLAEMAASATAGPHGAAHVPRCGRGDGDGRRHGLGFSGAAAGLSARGPPRWARSAEPRSAGRCRTDAHPRLPTSGNHSWQRRLDDGNSHGTETR